MSSGASAVFLCNGATAPRRSQRYRRATALDYRDHPTSPRNVTLRLPAFVNQLPHVPARILDLLEIAGYVFAGDRLTRRGTVDALEYHSWARTFEFVIRVRDPDFWRGSHVLGALTAALRFMTGDRDYAFTFLDGHSTEPVHIFDAAEVSPAPPTNTRVMLFSGGLDSLAGALDSLADRSITACLVSHESQHGTIKTQRALADALRDRFGNRVQPYAFKCRLADRRAAEETQRTRAFLYLSVAYAVAHSIGLRECFVYENGFTAFAFPERQDLLNARASRTTHPKSMALLSRLLSACSEGDFEIRTPFRWLTKAGIFRKIAEHRATDLLTSSVSCSATFQHAELGRQCGKCSQCVERRLAAFAAEVGDIDSSGTYAFDCIRDAVDDPEAKTLLVDYLRLARQFALHDASWFQREKINELADLIDYVDGRDDEDRLEKIWDLCTRHGHEVLRAIRCIRDKYDDPAKERPKGTLLDIVAGREYLKEPVDRMLIRLSSILRTALPLAFRSRRPEHENELNDQIETLLAAHSSDFEREFPVVRFGTAKTVPDHSHPELDLFIEAKLLRKGKGHSRVTDELAADTVKYGNHRRILFVLFDPDRVVPDDVKFAAPFEAKGTCSVCFVR